jgi:hypothetical protein
VRGFAAFIMRGRAQAVMVAAVCTVLSLLLAPLSYVGAAAIALVTLRVGQRDGMLVMAGAGLAAGLLAWLALGSPLPALAFAIMFWLPVWLLAVLLRQGVSQGLVLAAAGGLGLLGVIFVHLLVPVPADWWRELLREVLLPMLEQRDVRIEPAVLEQAAQLMTGLVAAITILGALLSLYLGRWWQALLYNPGGFATEFRGLRLHRLVAVATALVVVGTVVAGDALGTLGLEFVILAVLLYTVQGLAVAHALVASRGLSVGWLFGLYFALLFLSPQSTLVVGMAGYADSWLDFRARFGSV